MEEDEYLDGVDSNNNLFHNHAYSCRNFTNIVMLSGPAINNVKGLYVEARRIWSIIGLSNVDGCGCSNTMQCMD
ncbi:hypothetical protein NC653_005476 [Populus alba x Populus x berolinensis]|uniref:Uncharacterized protein n=1 Tax=Populus alba x Populus x berolinensis TaxID=444605 RepID=A0AAD6RD79_9ROSI|nr:hypothetical protein NC653_005476 [Populus alba x Populus x berolinensis]